MIASYPVRTVFVFSSRCSLNRLVDVVGIKQIGNFNICRLIPTPRVIAALLRRLCMTNGRLKRNETSSTSLNVRSDDTDQRDPTYKCPMGNELLRATSK